MVEQAQLAFSSSEHIHTRSFELRKFQTPSLVLYSITRHLGLSVPVHGKLSRHAGTPITQHTRPMRSTRSSARRAALHTRLCMHLLGSLMGRSTSLRPHPKRTSTPTVSTVRGFRGCVPDGSSGCHCGRSSHMSTERSRCSLLAFSAATEAMFYL